MEITKLYEIIQIQGSHIERCNIVINDALKILKEKDEIIRLLQKNVEITEKLRLVDSALLLNPSLN